MAGAKHLDVGNDLKVPSTAGSEHSSFRMTPNPLEMSVQTGFKLPKKDTPNPNVLPHGNDLMDVHYIGGIYNERIHRSVWEIDRSEMPYLKYVKKLSKGWPHIEWLADYMEVGTSPIKWKVLTPAHIKERAERTRVAVFEFAQTGEAPLRTNIHNSENLRQRLSESDLKDDPVYARLFVVEDMSRDVIEALGAKYDIDPLYFRSQISDYLWYNTGDPWAELSDLPHIASKRNYYNIRYMRARYFESETAIEAAKGYLGHFNVLRRLEEDLSWKVRELKKPTGPTVGVVRSKTALWIRKNKNDEEGVIGILVVDPTLPNGYPLWGGPRNLKPCPSMHSKIPDSERPQTLFEDVCQYATIMTASQIKSIAEEPRALGLPITSLVAAEWMSVVSYIITGLTKIEWELEHPFYRRKSDGLSGLLDRLHPLRRLIPVYRMMICETLNTILNEESLDTGKGNLATLELSKIRKDFESILASIDQLQTRTQNIISLATTIIGVEENQRAMKMNKNLVRVTYLAVVFAPMAFISSFFSMTADLSSLKDTFWIYVAVAIPVTAICLLIADHRRLFKYVKNQFRKAKKAVGWPEKEKKEEDRKEGDEKI